jgi:hypothetical protein
MNTAEKQPSAHKAGWKRACLVSFMLSVSLVFSSCQWVKSAYAPMVPDPDVMDLSTGIIPPVQATLPDPVQQERVVLLEVFTFDD